jgi:hypothetical protein
VAGVWAAEFAGAVDAGRAAAATPSSEPSSV